MDVVECPETQPPPPYSLTAPADHIPRPSTSNGNKPPPPPAVRKDDTSWLRPTGALRLRTSMPDLSAGRHSPSMSASPSSYSPSLRSATPFGSSATNTSASTPISTPGDSPDKVFWQSALSEARHFAGGLIPHPTESTKHFTILRHSPALVFYRGAATSVEISIFSSPDHPLPADRTLWMQQRGYSGDSGMKLKAFAGKTDDWVEVTPAVQARIEELAPEDERAWQRDIVKVSKKAVKDKGDAKAHVPRETHVVRIPAVSADGYFRFILCTGDASKLKVLCQSAIFRVASTSSDSSVFRGASLSTMPIEVGVKVASVAANVAVKKYTGPVVGLVSSKVDKLKPGVRIREVGKYALSKLPDQSSPTTSPQYFPDLDPQAAAAMFNSEQLNPLGPDTGPEAPFPLKFSGKLGIPTANLAALTPDDIPHRLKGVYFGWAALVPSNPNAPLTWHQAIITSAPSPYTRAAVVQENIITAHLLHEFPSQFTNSKLKLIVMGFMRPFLPHNSPLQQQLDMVSRDVILTVASLSSTREQWAPEVTVRRLKGVKSARNLGERFGEVRDTMQRRMDTAVPLHKLGVRTEGVVERDRAVGRGGYWVKRG
ncbi:hypothetical protein QBC34DRAFT_485287 [Podospora aff. communis PSN243]|uniref:Riboflavin kinase n=1 Tax=Podospora aff. communis PSN243 TaxID=3040156 RepID=A0AAV9GLG6_9PEZI|nr:hypothetical protein QBC34DRAFT_485287 [Podospora aff. communis PSN243]